MKATAVAPANIAFIKYWGKADGTRRIPANPSISMNLSACVTTTTVEFSQSFTEDRVSEGYDAKRIIGYIDRLRVIAKTKDKVRMQTHNSFPASAGIASSASGFAALTVAAAAALGLKLNEQELSAFARLGSGSACRSIPDGFVKWEGEYAYSLYPPEYWDIRDFIVIVETSAKKISSTAGHDTASTSPFFRQRLEAIPGRIAQLEKALKEKNFPLFGRIIEEDCLDMHHVMQTQRPPLHYWTPETDRVIHMVKSSGLPVFFTVDAGSNVHLICEGKNEKKLANILKGEQCIVNKPVQGAHIISSHLF